MTGTVGLVLAGAAARGPYQAGALGELLPALDAEGHRPVVLLGTSSGGITAALTAQFADLPAGEAGERVVDTWVNFGAVFANPLFSVQPGLSLVARFLGVGIVDAANALLDVTPLRNRATELFEPARVAGNIAAGHVGSLAVAATVCPPTGSAARTRLFVQGALPQRELDDYVDVVPTDLSVDHLLASAAIPMMFPPVHVPQPADVAGYYVDGGVRLNAPFDAALAMGVERLVVVSGHSVDPPAAPPVTAGSPPDIAAGAAVSVRAVLADALADDLRSLRRKNARPHYRKVRHLVVAPQDGELARLAAAAFHPSGPGDPYWTIGRLLDSLGEGGGRDELLSLILFQREYAAALVESGRRGARAALAAGWLL
jgi:NTE family protein